MMDTQELRIVTGLVRKIDTHHGSMGGPISVMIVAVVAWSALKEFVGTTLGMFGRLG